MSAKVAMSKARLNYILSFHTCDKECGLANFVCDYRPRGDEESDECPCQWVSRLVCECNEKEGKEHDDA